MRQREQTQAGNEAEEDCGAGLPETNRHRIAQGRDRVNAEEQQDNAGYLERRGIGDIGKECVKNHIENCYGES